MPSARDDDTTQQCPAERFTLIRATLATEAHASISVGLAEYQIHDSLATLLARRPDAPYPTPTSARAYLSLLAIANAASPATRIEGFSRGTLR
jgi:hypothetical protein